MTPRELVFSGEESCDEFVVEMLGKIEQQKAQVLPAYLKGLPFQFYREEVTEENALTEDAKDFKKVKEKMMEKFAAKLTVAYATVRAVNLKNRGRDMKQFLTKAAKLSEQAKIDDEAKYGWIKETIGDDQELIKFTVLRNAKPYEAVKEACIEFTENPNVLTSESRKAGASTGRSVATIDDLAEEMKTSPDLQKSE